MNKAIVVEDAWIQWKNFSGAGSQFNPEGRRNFCLMLSKEMAEDLADQGYNVKFLRPIEEGDDPQPFISVAVNFNNRPPKIVMITSAGKTILDEESVNVLDWADIDRVDLSFVPYEWNVGGRRGLKAYLKTLYATVHEDEFEKKYADLPSYNE